MLTKKQATINMFFWLLTNTIYIRSADPEYALTNVSRTKKLRQKSQGFVVEKREYARFASTYNIGLIVE